MRYTVTSILYKGEEKLTKSQQYHGGPQKRVHASQGIYGPTTTPVESFSDHHLFTEQYFRNDESTLLSLSPDEVNGLNSCPLQIDNTQRQSGPSETSQMDQAHLQAIADNVVIQMQDRFGQFDNIKARQSPFTEMDQQGPWTPLDMGGDKACRPGMTSLQTRWNQREHRPALFQNPQVNCLEMKNGNVMQRTQSDSGYGTIPNKSPPLHSTTQSMYGGEALTTMQDCSSLANDLNEISFQPGYGFDFDQFTDNGLAVPFPDVKPTSNSERIPNPPHENGPFICETCLRNGNRGLANLKNRSEWK